MFGCKCTSGNLCIFSSCRIMMKKCAFDKTLVPESTPSTQNHPATNNSMKAELCSKATMSWTKQDFQQSLLMFPAAHPGVRSDVATMRLPETRVTPIGKGISMLLHTTFLSSALQSASVVVSSYRKSSIVRSCMSAVVPSLAECCLIREHLNLGVLRVHAFPASQSAPAMISEMLE